MPVSAWCSGWHGSEFEGLRGCGDLPQPFFLALWRWWGVLGLMGLE